MPRLPSMQALRALESFARHGTVWQAADELHLTRSAVSHQLRQLERDLGFALTSQSGNRSALTPQGAEYAAEVRRALAALNGAAARASGREIGGSLTVSVTPGFASSFLCPRIGTFQQAYPDVALTLVSPRRLDDLGQPEVDVFISFSRGAPAGSDAELLLEVSFTPLVSPMLLNRLGGLTSPRELARARLLHLVDHGDWNEWFARAGLSPPQAPGLCCSDMNMVLSSALAGQGVAIGDVFTCAGALASGQLVRPFDLAISSDRAYWLFLAGGRSGNAAAAAFRDWLLDELSAP